MNKLDILWELFPNVRDNKRISCLEKELSDLSITKDCRHKNKHSIDKLKQQIENILSLLSENSISCEEYNIFLNIKDYAITIIDNDSNLALVKKCENRMMELENKLLGH